MIAARGYRIKRNDNVLTRKHPDNRVDILTGNGYLGCIRWGSERERLDWWIQTRLLQKRFETKKLMAAKQRIAYLDSKIKDLLIDRMDAPYDTVRV